MSLRSNTGNWIDTISAQSGVPSSFELIARYLRAEKRMAGRAAVVMEHQLANIIRREFYDDFMVFVESQTTTNSLDSDVSDDSCNSD